LIVSALTLQETRVVLIRHYFTYQAIARKIELAQQEPYKGLLGGYGDIVTSAFFRLLNLLAHFKQNAYFYFVRLTRKPAIPDGMRVSMPHLR